MEAFLAVIVAFVAFVVLTLPVAWVTMLFLGAFASTSGFTGAALGFWSTFWLVLAIRTSMVGLGATSGKPQVIA